MICKHCSKSYDVTWFFGGIYGCKGCADKFYLDLKSKGVRVIKNAED